MQTDNSNEEIDQIFSKIKSHLPQDWLTQSEELRLHHLLDAINETLHPKGSWVLVNGEMTLLQLLHEKKQ